MKNFIKTYKEELLALPLLILGLMTFKWFLNSVYPESAQFDLASETETIFWAIIKLIVFTSSAWFALRVVFPKVFNYLKNNFYQEFDKLECTEKRGLSLKIFFAFLFALVFLSSGFAQEKQLRLDLKDQLESQLDVREATGNNDGYAVEQYLASVGLGKGYPWCAAFTTWNLNHCNIPNPQSAWSPSWAKEKDIVWSRRLVKSHKVRMYPRMGDNFTIYYPSLKRVGHVGFYMGTSRDGYFITIEGNTNNDGSRNGIGVFKRKRHPRKVFAITNYITPHYEKTYTSAINFNGLQLSTSARDSKYKTNYRLYKGKYASSKKGYVSNDTGGLFSNKGSNKQTIENDGSKNNAQNQIELTKGRQYYRSYLFSSGASKANRAFRNHYYFGAQGKGNEQSTNNTRGILLGSDYQFSPNYWWDPNCYQFASSSEPIPSI